MRPPQSMLVRIARSPLMTTLGIITLAISLYPRLWAKDGSRHSIFDADIYWRAIRFWHEGGSLYDWWADPDAHRWPFTYPPFAAWVMTPLEFVSRKSAGFLLVVSTPVAMGITIALTLWLLGRRRGLSLIDAFRLAPWGTALAVTVVEPVYKTMEYGQINAILMVVVVIDLFAVEGRGRGILSGVAAAIKLTPAIAILVFVARREWRAAATITTTALGLSAIVWVVSPAESARFFLSAMWDPTRAGDATYSGNQNLKAVLARVLPRSAITPAWALASLVVVVLTIMVARRLDHVRDRLGQEHVLVMQTVVVMMCGLLISPISWSHHWVWVIPALLVLGDLCRIPHGVAAGHTRQTPDETGLAHMKLGVRTHNETSPPEGVISAVIVAFVTGIAVFIAAPHWWFPEGGVESSWAIWQKIVGASYVWWALTLGSAAWHVSKRTR